MPPNCANAIAIKDSVTVSIAAEIIGTSKFIDLVNSVLVFTFAGRVKEDAGFRGPKEYELKDWFDEIKSAKFKIEGFEWAIVLPPKEGIYLDDPIAVLDYASLYPSSIIEKNFEQFYNWLNYIYFLVLHMSMSQILDVKCTCHLIM